LISVALAASAHRIVTTIVVAIFALIALGVSSSKAGGANPLRPTFRVVFGGLVAMAFTIAVGRFVGAAVA
jgi:VIT1/CCC1 family predicted Fe2+/Mn2+ transporter